MTIAFNSYTLTNTTNQSSLGWYMINGPKAAYTVNRLRVFPTTVSYPSLAGNVDSSTSGYILEFSGTFSLSGSKIIFSNVTLSANASAAGTASWFLITGSGAASSQPVVLISDSVTASGGAGILQLSTLTPTLGQSVVAAYNLTIS